MRKRAFTMIEMVAVAMIVALISGLAVMTLNRDSAAGDGADFARRMDALAASARLRAVRLAGEARVEYRSGAREWALVGDAGCDPVKLPDGARLEIDGKEPDIGESPVFRFLPDGTSCSPEISVVQAAQGRCWKLWCSQLTGGFYCVEGKYPEPPRKVELLWEDK